VLHDTTQHIAMAYGLAATMGRGLSHKVSGRLMCPLCRLFGVVIPPVY